MRADVLKVPHHGSAFFDPAFLAAVHARLGVISVGADNDYGHPATSLLAALQRLGAVVRRTDRDGDVAVAGDSVALRTVLHAGSAALASYPVAPGIVAPGIAAPRRGCARLGCPRHGRARGAGGPRRGRVGGGCQDGRMAAARTVRGATVDDLPDPLPPVALVVGDEELLVTRAVGALAAAARRADPEVLETERAGADIEGPELHELLGPSLFGDSRLVVIRAAQDLRAAAVGVLTPYLDTPVEGATLVLQHAGGAKGKAVLEAARKRAALEIPCARVTRTDERTDFVRAEVRRAGGRIEAAAVAALVDAVGSDLRELAMTAAQLVGDSDGAITVDVVRAYHQGRAEVSGFAISDLAVVGNAPAALEALRYALDVGVPYVVIADALADGVRTIARVTAAGRGNEFQLAKRLALPPWKVKRALAQGRGWTEPGLRRALQSVAVLNADVKGEAVSPAWALERTVRALASARAQRA